MKTIIFRSNINQSVDVNQDIEHFSKLISALNQVGISSKYCLIQSNLDVQDFLQKETPDIVFCADMYVQKNGNEKINLHSFLDEMQVAYIGSTPSVLELVISKSKLKKRWQEYGVSTPPFFIIHKNDDKEPIFLQATSFPYILKPDCEGNSRGLDESSIVFDLPALRKKTDELLEIFDSILMEKFLDTSAGIREFTVALIGNQNHRLLMPAEITLKHSKEIRIITTKDKDCHNTLATPITDQELREKLINFSAKAFDASGVRDYSRCDLILWNGQLFAIEINGQPMIPDKWFEMCARGSAMDNEQYIHAIFLAGIVRNIKQGKVNLEVPDRLIHNLPMEILRTLI